MPRPPRVWRQLPAPPTPGHVLRVLQYNILADCLAEGSEGAVEQADCAAHFRAAGSAGVHYHRSPLDSCHVFRTPQANLVWERRLPLLLADIAAERPDVLCLQEVDHFPDLERSLASEGFAGRFFKKKGKRISDGSAIFWRHATLTEAAWEGFHLLHNVMTALAVRLVTQSGLAIVACATHLKAGFSVEMETVRSDQAQELVRRLTSFAGPDPIILGADLNAHHSPYHRCTAERCCDSDELVTPLVVPMLEKHGFRNAYGEYPSFTTWGGWLDRDVKATLDYILLSGPVAGVAALDVPEDGFVADLPERLPNAEWPSDHVYLVAEVCLTEVPDAAAVAQRSSGSRRGGKGRGRSGEDDSQIKRITSSWKQPPQGKNDGSSWSFYGSGGESKGNHGGTHVGEAWRSRDFGSGSSHGWSNGWAAGVAWSDGWTAGVAWSASAGEAWSHGADSWQQPVRPKAPREAPREEAEPAECKQQ